MSFTSLSQLLPHIPLWYSVAVCKGIQLVCHAQQYVTLLHRSPDEHENSLYLVPSVFYSCTDQEVGSLSRCIRRFLQCAGFWSHSLQELCSLHQALFCACFVSSVILVMRGMCLSAPELHFEAAFHKDLTTSSSMWRLCTMQNQFYMGESMYCKVCEHSIRFYALLHTEPPLACLAMPSSLHPVLPPF